MGQPAKKRDTPRAATSRKSTAVPAEAGITVTGTDAADEAPLDELEMSAWRAFYRATVQVPRKLEADLHASHGLSLAAYGVLVMLSEAPDRSLRMRELSDELGLTRSAITRLVDRLAGLGFVERHTCESDARGWLAHLTDAGFAGLEAAYPTHLASVRRHVFGQLKAADVKKLRTLMTALGADD